LSDEKSKRRGSFSFHGGMQVTRFVEFSRMSHIWFAVHTPIELCLHVYYVSHHSSVCDNQGNCRGSVRGGAGVTVWVIEMYTDLTLPILKCIDSLSV